MDCTRANEQQREDSATEIPELCIKEIMLFVLKKGMYPMQGRIYTSQVDTCGGFTRLGHLNPSHFHPHEEALLTQDFWHLLDD